MGEHVAQRVLGQAEVHGTAIRTSARMSNGHNSLRAMASHYFMEGETRNLEDRVDIEKGQSCCLLYLEPFIESSLRSYQGVRCGQEGSL